MFEYLQKLFESKGFMPHGHCYFWRPEILATNVIGDWLIALAYFSIPPILFYLVRKREDLTHRYVIVLFALFILACGTTHIIEIITVWTPVYRIQGLIKIITGLISVATAVLLYRAIPMLVSLPSHARLEGVNEKLREEVAERETAQVALRQANEALESRVQQRTAQLIKINRELEKEIEVRKKTENNLMEKNLELSRINSDLDNFLYCASHDLRAPIVNIEGLVTALKEEIPQPGEHLTTILKHLDGSLLKVDRTMLDLNEVSRLQKIDGNMPKEVLHFEDVLAEVKTELRGLLQETTVEITADFSEAPTVKFNRRDLKSIFYNLFLNALQLRDQQRLPRLSLKTSFTENYLLLTLTDNGIGIDLKKNEWKIFSLFRHLNENVQGTGMGLYIVKRILDINGGQIKVKSTPGVGSKFEVCFPKA